MHKKNFTLIEVIVSLFIVAILLTVLFRFFSQIVICEKNMQDIKRESLQKHSFEVKLNNVFSQIVSKKNSEKASFYTKKNSLYFQFDNGLDQNPQFCSLISGQLYLDNKKNLILKTTPLENKEIEREEILIKDIEKLEFYFYKKNQPQKNPEKEKNYVFSKSWTQKNIDLPVFLEICLKKVNQEKLCFTFYFPSIQSSITYFERKKI